MNPVNLNDFMHVLDYPTNQQYLHMICLFVTTLYCTSTESKFVHKVDPLQFSEAENYLSRALEIAYLYLPKDLPLINQLLNVHNRFYDISKQVIDEDAKMKLDGLNFEIVLLKPVIEATRSGFAIPIIRKSKFVGMKNRTRSMKEQQFQNIKQVNFNPESDLITYENGNKVHKRKLRSISTTNKHKPNSPKWINHQLADVYLNQQYPFKSVQIKKQAQKYNNRTVEQNSGKTPTSTSKFNRSENQMKKKQLNINFIAVNGITNSSSTQNSYSNAAQFTNVQQAAFKRKRVNQSFNFDQLTAKSPVNQFLAKQKEERTKNATIQSKIKSVIKQYQA